MTTRYIQRKDSRYRETVDSLCLSDFPTMRAFRKELARLVAEYRMSDGAADYYTSRRPCANWGAV